MISSPINSGRFYKINKFKLFLIIIMQTLKSIFDKELDRLINLQQSIEPVAALSSGFTNLNLTINGFKPQSLYLLASRPESGKTVFLLNLLFNITINKKKPVKAILYSLDVSSSEVGQRLMSCNSSIELKKILYGIYDPNSLSKIYVDIDQINALTNNLLVEDNPICTIDSIRKQLEELQIKNELPSFVAIDNVDAIILPEAPSKAEAVKLLYEQLKQIAIDFSIPVMATTEIPYEYFVSDDDQMPRLKMLTRKDIPLSLLDAVMFIVRPDYYELQGSYGEPNTDAENSEQGFHSQFNTGTKLPKGFGEAHLIIAINRFGPASTVRLIANMQYQRFYEDEKVRF